VGVIGHLWLEYDIDLFEAQSSMLATAPLLVQTFRRWNAGYQLLLDAPSNVIFDLSPPANPAAGDPKLMGPIQTSVDSYTLHRATYDILFDLEVYNGGPSVTSASAGIYSSRGGYLQLRDISVEPGKIQILNLNYRFAAQEGDVITFPMASTNSLVQLSANGSARAAFRPA
jgi:hypothetical protein